VTDTVNEQQGTVQWFDSKKGYGFIAVPDAPNAMVHYSDIEMEGFRTLREGQTVFFVLQETEKGLKAVRVRPADTTEEPI